MGKREKGRRASLAVQPGGPAWRVSLYAVFKHINLPPSQSKPK